MPTIRVMEDAFKDIVDARAARQATARIKGWDRDWSVFDRYVSLGFEPNRQEIERLSKADSSRPANLPRSRAIA
jgi:hypothetical protein